MEIIKKRDVIRRLLTLFLIVLVFRETGVATASFAFLVAVESEARTLIDRANNELIHEYTRALNLIAKLCGVKEAEK
jgi:hypothetical protein